MTNLKFMQNCALIGYTGFVGKNLTRQANFDFLFNTKNIHEIANGEFEQVVCCGVSAVKWLANRDPQADKEKIDALLAILKTIKAKQFILISTIDVYPNTINVDELTVVGGLPNHAYGFNRYFVEQFVREYFENALIVRLPALFGEGLKKNVLFDLLHNNCLDAINPHNKFQWYDLADLWKDIEIALQNNLKLVNFSTEPVTTEEIISRYFPEKMHSVSGFGVAVSYDVKTLYAHLFGGKSHYLFDKIKVFDRMSRFLKEVRNGSGIL